MSSGEKIPEDEEKIIQDLVSKLKFISKIKEEQIVDLQSFSVMEHCISTSIYRTCIRQGTENRDDVYLFFIQQ